MPVAAAHTQLPQRGPLRGLLDRSYLPRWWQMWPLEGEHNCFELLSWQRDKHNHNHNTNQFSEFLFYSGAGKSPLLELGIKIFFPLLFRDIIGVFHPEVTLQCVCGESMCSLSPHSPQPLSLPDAPAESARQPGHGHCADRNLWAPKQIEGAHVHRLDDATSLRWQFSSKWLYIQCNLFQNPSRFFFSFRNWQAIPEGKNSQKNSEKEELEGLHFSWLQNLL